MKHVTRTAVAFGFAALLPLSTLAAAAATHEIGRVEVREDPRSIPERRTTAEILRSEGRLDESLRAYNAVLTIQQDHRLDATETLWAIAEIQLARGDVFRSARALDGLADEAARHGHVEIQARALFESAMSYASINQHGFANERMSRLRPLLDSEEISPGLRERIARRTNRR